MLFRKSGFREEKYSFSLEGVPFEVARKNIKHMYIRLCPDTGIVKISAPRGVSRGVIKGFALTKLAWINKHRPAAVKKIRTSRSFKTGEAHYFRGEEYRLDVILRDGPPGVELIAADKTIRLCIRKEESPEKKRELLESWYTARLKERLAGLVPEWEKKIGASAKEWRVRKMKRRWGTCSVNERRIWFNLELVKKPDRCLEYIVVHELAHLLEAGHNRKYRELMDKLLPEWRELKDELNNFPG